MPTLECCYLVTSMPLCGICAYTPPPTFQPPNVSGLRRDPGRLTPSLQAHLPSSLFPPADPHSDRPLFTFTLLHGPAGQGGQPNRYIIVWSSLAAAAPLPSRPSLTPFTVLKSTICITQQSGSEREGEMG